VVVEARFNSARATILLLQEEEGEEEHTDLICHLVSLVMAVVQEEV